MQERRATVMALSEIEEKFGWDFNNIPKELQELNLWCVCALKWNDKKHGDAGAFDKQPIPLDRKRTTGYLDNGELNKKISVTWNDPNALCSAKEAIDYCRKYSDVQKGYLYIPTVKIEANSAYVGIDLDDVYNPQKGEKGEITSSSAASILNSFLDAKAHVYVEISTSKTGFHILGKVNKPEDKQQYGERKAVKKDLYKDADAGIKDIGSIEFYKTHLLCFTGAAKITGMSYQKFSDATLIFDKIYRERIEAVENSNDSNNNCNVTIVNDVPEITLTEEEKAFRASVPEEDEIILDKMFSSKKQYRLEAGKTITYGEMYRRLYNGDTTIYGDRSRTFFALCKELSYYTVKDGARVLAIIDKSPLCTNHNSYWYDNNSHGVIEGHKLNMAQITVYNAMINCDSVFNWEYNEGSVKRSDVLEAIESMQPERTYTRDDRGNGQMFARIFKDNTRYCSTAKQWYYYDGEVWKIDAKGMKAKEKAKILCDALRQYAKAMCSKAREKLTGLINEVKKLLDGAQGAAKESKAISTKELIKNVQQCPELAEKEEVKELIYCENDENSCEGYLKFVAKLGDLFTRKKMLEDAESENAFELQDLDAIKDVINLKNGTLDLNTFELYAHKPEDLLTKVCNAEYKPEAKCDRWLSFIDEVMQGDKEKGKYLQKAVGSMLTGEATDAKMFILYGATTRNGKGTFISTISHVMGGYAVSVNPETLAQKKNADGSKASPDIARLAGCRFASASEPKKNMQFDEVLIKQLTGGDKITARELYQDPFEFIPQFTLFMDCNYTPDIRDDTLFTSERIKVITFDRHFEESEQDKNLKKELQKPENAAGILNWMLEGLKLYRDEGLVAPECVRTATEAYRAENDKVQQFITENMIKEKDGKTTLKDLYERYRPFCENEGVYPESNQHFKRALMQKGIRFKQKENGTRNVVHGWRLKAESEKDITENFEDCENIKTPFDDVKK